MYIFNLKIPKYYVMGKIIKICISTHLKNPKCDNMGKWSRFTYPFI